MSINQKTPLGPLGALLSSLREEAGLSLRKLEDLCSISRSSLQRFESGSLSPRISDLLYLLQILSKETGRAEEEVSALVFSALQLWDSPLQQTITIEVAGAPVPKGRPIVTHKGTYTPKKTKDALGVWQRACIGYKPFPRDTPLHLDLLFIFPRPQRLKKSSSPRERIWHTVRPDADNLFKLVADGLEQGGLLKCDSRISSFFVQKWFAAGQGEDGWEAPRSIAKISVIKEG